MAKYMIQGIDDDLWKLFKIFCAMEDVSMCEKLKEMIKEEVERAKRKYGRKEG